MQPLGSQAAAWNDDFRCDEINSFIRPQYLITAYSESEYERQIEA